MKSNVFCGSVPRYQVLVFLQLMYPDDSLSGKTSASSARLLRLLHLPRLGRAQFCVAFPLGPYLIFSDTLRLVVAGCGGHN